jgi:trehalose 6-phosphate synthase/phosphatase
MLKGQENLNRLIIVSNRLPIIVERRRGKLLFEPSVGGLVTALKTFYKSRHGLWIGWPGIELGKIGNEKQELEAKLASESCYPVFLSQADVEGYYLGFCNNTIWPLFHYFPEFAVYRKDFWQIYEKVNRVFADIIAGTAKTGDIIWVHDYHLMLLPKLIRERLPDAMVGFFFHIPFPSFEIFRLLPWRRQILEGLLGADLVGFHTYDYAQHFLNSVHSLLGYENVMGRIITADNITKADVFPLGIDYQRYNRAARSSSVRDQANKVRRRLLNRKKILSIDRLDYTKGIPERLRAFDLFLEKHPEYREKIVLVLVVVPSRTRVEQYATLKKQVDELVGTINGKYGTIGWVPIWYLYRALPFDYLVALYEMADIALITPLRDGMNLIAKEYIATKTNRDGVLILSETAGAARELGEAIIINVNNPDEIVQALEDALAMPKKEQKKYNRIMQKRLQRYNVERWANEFIDRLFHTRELKDEIEAKALNDETKSKLITDFQKSEQRLLLLDYDGTLMPFSDRPEDARPSSKLKKMLKQLAQDQRNEVVLISGRDKQTLEKWFGGLKIGLVAEHGALTKEREKQWETLGTLATDWKEEVRPILELFVDRTPGSFIEEKEFSLGWHYRKTGPGLGEVRARELVTDLLNLTSNLNLQVLEGSRIIEVKNAGINKGQAALQWIPRKTWDFTLAIGDDLTDEDIFKVLPTTAWSIKVGFSTSAAQLNLRSTSQVTSLLTEMIKST